MKNLKTILKCILILLFIAFVCSLDGSEQLQNFEDAVDRVREELVELKNSINIQSENLLKQRRSIEDLLSSFDSKDETDKLDEWLQSPKSRKRSRNGLNSEDNYNIEEDLNFDKEQLDAAELQEAIDADNNCAADSGTTNDESNKRQNDFSHEANYKLSKLEQDASENRKQSSVQFPDWKRSAQFNPMNEVKLRTSSRLMDRGFGPSLPSFSLEDNQHDILIDDMLKKLEKNWVTGAGKYDSLDKNADNTKDYDFNGADTFAIQNARLKRLYGKSQHKTNEERLEESEKFPLSSLANDKDSLEDFIQSLKGPERNTNEQENSFNADNEKEQNINKNTENLEDSNAEANVNSNSDSLTKKSSDASDEQKSEEKDSNARLENAAVSLNAAKQSDSKLKSENAQNEQKLNTVDHIQRSSEEIHSPEKDIGENHAVQADKSNAEDQMSKNNEYDADADYADVPEMQKYENDMANDKIADFNQAENADYLGDNEPAYADIDSVNAQKRSAEDRKAEFLNMLENKADQLANMQRMRGELSDTNKNDEQPPMLVRTKRQAVEQKTINVAQKSVNNPKTQESSKECRNKKAIEKNLRICKNTDKVARNDEEKNEISAGTTLIEINNDLQLANLLNSNFKIPDNYYMNNKVNNDNLEESKTDMQEEMSAQLNPLTNEQLLIYVPSSKEQNQISSDKLAQTRNIVHFKKHHKSTLANQHYKNNKEDFKIDCDAMASNNKVENLQTATECEPQEKSISSGSNNQQVLNCPHLDHLKIVITSGQSTTAATPVSTNVNGSTTTPLKNEEQKKDAVKLNVAINANILGPQDKKFCGNGTIKMQPALIEDRSRRGIFFPDFDKPFTRAQFMHKPRSSSCTETDDKPINNLLNGKLSSEVVKSVYSLVRSTPKFRVLWPAFKHNKLKRNQHFQNFYSIRNCKSEPKVRNVEGLMERAMECINDIVDQQARLRTCVPLRPDLAGFYELILETYQQQDRERDRRETPTHNKYQPEVQHTIVDAQQIEEKSATIKNLLQQYEELPLKQKFQASKLRDGLLKDLMYLRQLKELHDEWERKRREQVLQEHDRAQQQEPIDDEYIKQYESLMSPEYLKLMKTAELFCEAQN